MKQEAHWTKPVPQYDNRVPTWKRFVAFLFDIIVFSIIVGLPIAEAVGIPSEANQGVVALFLYTFFFAYVVLAQYLASQTLGMMLMRYHVKQHVDLWRCVVRNLFIIPVFPFIALWVVDPVYMAFTGDRLTERWAGATVEVTL